MKPTQKPATDQELTPAEILRDAARYLKRFGWIQGSYYNLADGSVNTDVYPPACAGGAIAVVSYGQVVDDPYGAYTLAEHDEFTRVWDFFDDFLTLINAQSADIDDPDEERTSVFGWNDTPGRTIDDVIAVLNAAADDWDSLQGGAR